MNTQYAVALLEGHLAKEYELPEIIQGALDHLKALDLPKPVAVKKKRKMTKEQREKNLATLAKMRETMRQKRDAAKALKIAA